MLGAALAFTLSYYFGLRDIPLICVGVLLTFLCGSSLTVIGLLVLRPELERRVRPTFANPEELLATAGDGFRCQPIKGPYEQNL
jgi:hypothetical protein